MKQPIVIIANYRTGSTAYSMIRAAEHNFVNFPEPHIQPETFKQLETMIDEGRTNFVLKIMPDQVSLNSTYQQVLEQNCHTIKLTRNDKVAQIVSHYTARITNKWNSSNPNIRGQVYDIPVIKQSLIGVIKYILTQDRLLDSYGINFDEELTYESITDLLTNTSLYQLPKKLTTPSNYEELIKYTAQLLKELGLD
jgi:hypothetical protein